jgi:DNA primase
MSNQVDEVKSKVDIVSLIGEFVELKKAGSNFKGLCPFHSEKTPSFMVSPELQIFKCFGCGESGDVISFMQKYEGMEFYEALQFLAKRAGVKLKPISGEDKGKKQKLYEINKLVSRFYGYFLLEHPSGRPALDYLLKKRGLGKKTIEQFKLGFSPNKPFALKRYLVEKKKMSLSDLEEAGVVYVKNSSGMDRMRGRVVFSLFDHRDNIVGFAGRILPWDKRDLAKYINTPETPIYHKSRVLYGLNLVKDNIRKSKVAVVVEGELDMISSWQAGVKNTVAIKGSALTKEQIRLISRYAKEVVLALDADIAGDMAARKGVILANDEGLDVRVARLGNYKDPDDMVKQDPEAYKKAIKKAVSMWDFMVESVFSKHNEKTGRGKTKISREITPILSLIKDKIVQAHYVEVVAEKLSVPSEAVSQQLLQSYVKPQERESKGQDFVEKKTRKQLLEERLLSIAFKIDNEVLNNRRYQKLFSTSLASRLLKEYKTYMKGKKNRQFDASVFAVSLPAELRQGFEDLMLKDVDGINEDDPDQYNKEAKVIVKELEALEIKERLIEVSRRIAEFEKNNNKKRLQQAKKEFGKLSNMLSELEDKNYKGIIL